LTTTSHRHHEGSFRLLGFAENMVLYREQARLVVKLLGHILPLCAEGWGRAWRCATNTCRLISVLPCASVIVTKWVDPTQCFSVPNTCSTVRRRRVMASSFPVQPPLDALQNLFVFPPADAPVVAGRALIFHGATRESTGLVEACVKTVPLDRGEPIDGAFACWALVLVIPGDVDEVASCRSAPGPWRATARRSR